MQELISFYGRLHERFFWEVFATEQYVKLFIANYINIQT